MLARPKAGKCKRLHYPKMNFVADTHAFHHRLSNSVYGARPIAGRRANQFDFVAIAPHADASRSRYRLREKVDFVSPIKLIWGVQSLREKYSALHSANSLASSLHPASSKRGVSRSSRTLEAGCYGRAMSQDERHGADGEVVWSWRPDAGANLATMLGITPTTVTTKPGLTGETTYKP
jgi:hypothetical protein